jgi:hypothetical protein
MKPLLIFPAFLMIAQAAWPQAALAPPQVGFIQDGHRRVRPVNGLAGNFLLGSARSRGVISAAFSGPFGMLKSESALVVTDRQGRTIAGMDAPPGSALFAFSADGFPALVYFPETNEFRVWDGQTFQPAAPDASSLRYQTVLTIAAPNSAAAAVVIESEDGLWELTIQLATGAMVSKMFLSGVTTPALLLAGGGLLYRDAQGVVVRRQDGSEMRVAARLPKSIAFGQMAADWVQVTDLATGRLFAISIRPDHERYYALPEVRQ